MRESKKYFGHVQEWAWFFCHLSPRAGFYLNNEVLVYFFAAAKNNSLFFCLPPPASALSAAIGGHVKK